MTSIYELAQLAIEGNSTLSSVVATRLSPESVDLQQAQAEGRLLAPIDRPDPAHIYVTGTGLTHLGSAEGRDKIHRAAAGGTVTDSMRMFMWGLEGGKPAGNAIGHNPNGSTKAMAVTGRAPGAALALPAFALDGGEEPEIAGIYLIGADGTPLRLGFASATSSPTTSPSAQNYLWLAHSKLRHAALGPELLIGELPARRRGIEPHPARRRPIWEKPFLTGEANMRTRIANLEHHHFKYALFRRPGDVHVHFFGTATLSFADGV